MVIDEEDRDTIAEYRYNEYTKGFDDSFNFDFDMEEKIRKYMQSSKVIGGLWANSLT